MTAKEIRDLDLTATYSEASASVRDCARFLREIAAQLAEQNETLRDIAFTVGVIADKPTPPPNRRTF